ncbi:MAG: 2-octaprenylphenol hydroxylase [Pseudomonadales bacterium]|nr:2-octaprenylphenol hydroxylase [Pseudomonadales bacterium]
MSVWTGGAFDVVVVGAGIAGSAFAALLAPSGLRILLLDAAPRPPRLPPLAATIDEVDLRVSALNPASVRLLEQAGAWQRLPREVASPYEHMRVWEEDGTARIGFDAAALGEPVLGHVVENRWIVATLLARLDEAANVVVRGGETLATLEQRAAGASRTRLWLASGAAVEAALVVGADGARSAVRTLCAIEAAERDTGQRALVATVTTERAHARTARQRFLTSGPLALLPLALPAGGQCCSIVWSADEALAEELLALDDAAFAARLGQASEHALGGIEAVSRRLAFPLRPLHAASYVAPGVALVGDAAHVIHPLAGQGINLGLADVRVLADELQRARARGLALADEGVLARYQRRRRGDNALMLETMDVLRRLYADRRPGVRLARNLGVAAVDALSPLKRALMRRAAGLG